MTMLDVQLVSYFTNFAVQNVNKACVYITDLKSTLRRNNESNDRCTKQNRFHASRMFQLHALPTELIIL